VGAWGGQGHVSATFPQNRDPFPIVQECCLTAGPVSTITEIVATTGIRSTDRPTCRQSLYELNYSDCALPTHIIQYCTSVMVNVPSGQKNSSGLKFPKSRTGSHMTYSYYHNSSRFTLPIFCICGVFVSSIPYNQSRTVYINRRHQHSHLIRS